MEQKSIQDFYNEILAAKEAQPVLNVLDSTSRAAIWRLWIYVCAVGSWLLQSVVSDHLEEVKGLIAAKKPGTVGWYKSIALDFQFGHGLVYGENHYDNSGLSDEDIAAAKVVKHAAVIGKLRGVRVKVAGEDSAGNLTPLTMEQEATLQAYLEQMRYAGVRVYLTNAIADLISLTSTILFNPEILSAEGKRLDGTNDTPVQDAIHNYLKNIKFDGGLITPADLLDAIRAVEGVITAHIDFIAGKYGDLDYIPFTKFYLPDAGYARIGEMNLNFEAFNGIG